MQTAKHEPEQGWSTGSVLCLRYSVSIILGLKAEAGRLVDGIVCGATLFKDEIGET